MTHFHLDHAASLPYLTEKTGFKGRVFCTHPTKAVMRMLLADYIRLVNVHTEDILYDEKVRVYLACCVVWGMYELERSCCFFTMEGRVVTRRCCVWLCERRRSFVFFLEDSRGVCVRAFLLFRGAACTSARLDLQRGSLLAHDLETVWGQKILKCGVFSVALPT